MKKKILQLSSVAVCILALASCGSNSASPEVSNYIEPQTTIPSGYTKMTAEEGKAAVDAITASMDEKVNEKLKTQNLIMTSEGIQRRTTDEVSVDKTDTIKSIIDFNNRKFSSHHEYLEHQYGKDEDGADADLKRSFSVDLCGTADDSAYTCIGHVKTNNYHYSDYETIKVYDEIFDMYIDTFKDNGYDLTIETDIAYTGGVAYYPYPYYISPIGLYSWLINEAETNDGYYFEYYKNDSGSIIRNLFNTHDFDEPVLWQSATYVDGIVAESWYYSSYSKKDMILVKYEFTDEKPAETDKAITDVSYTIQNIITLYRTYLLYYGSSDGSIYNDLQRTILKEYVKDHPEAIPQETTTE